MNTRRRQETADAEAAARRLAGITGRGRSAATAAPPDDPDDFDWFLPAPSPPPDAAPWSTLWPPEDDDVPAGASAVPPGSDADAPGSGRWRSFAGGAPAAVRGAAGVPLNAAIAVVLVVAAVVAGVLLRSHGGTSVVDVAPSRGVPSAAPVVAGGGPASGAAGATGATGGPLSGIVVGSGAASRTSAAVVVVDVVGKVRRPGLVRLPAGSRVADAVAAAGGPTDAAALPRINLARVLADGEQVVVPDADDPLPAAPAAGAGTSAAPGSAARSGPLDLNAATAADLDGLPGIGPVIAGRIVAWRAWRAEHQRFTRVDELAEVPGIGDRLLERLRPLVTV